MIFDGLPNQKFEVILADFPWSYYGQQDKWGAASKFYNTVSDDDIKSFPLKDLMSEKSVVFLWATSPRLDFCINLIQHWGLYYRGVSFVWVKTSKDGKPFGARGVRPSIVKPTCEFVLAASNVKSGRPLKLHDESIVNTIFAPLGEHSEKPSEVHKRIELMYPSNSKIELFARKKVDGWTCWGNEL